MASAAAITPLLATSLPMAPGFLPGLAAVMRPKTRSLNDILCLKLAKRLVALQSITMNLTERCKK
ncbi:hypothetical protein [Novosphingobium pokkalii]|jgi:hypothetical protein|uniref:Secreted protein n=1 Tax=Novosphingobium pokkalii TaxID=1770194 RepID=A0ABV7V1Y2_9SPHN|nr:hypothetical protein [Novosphingobium pokkalii]